MQIEALVTVKQANRGDKVAYFAALRSKGEAKAMSENQEITDIGMR